MPQADWRFILTAKCLQYTAGSSACILYTGSPQVNNVRLLDMSYLRMRIAIKPIVLKNLSKIQWFAIRNTCFSSLSTQGTVENIFIVVALLLCTVLLIQLTKSTQKTDFGNEPHS